MESRLERFVVDEAGNRVAVLLELAEYQSMLEDLEELESIRAYDIAKASGEKPIPFEQAIQEIERNRH
jgi:PHD/YefM family antitoxin component YafN of YafNO toxin-antitoxin module